MRAISGDATRSGMQSGDGGHKSKNNPEHGWSFSNTQLNPTATYLTFGRDGRVRPGRFSYSIPWRYLLPITA